MTCILMWILMLYGVASCLVVCLVTANVSRIFVLLILLSSVDSLLDYGFMCLFNLFCEK
jgi:hypothetical protein